MTPTMMKSKGSAKNVASKREPHKQKAANSQPVIASEDAFSQLRDKIETKLQAKPSKSGTPSQGPLTNAKRDTFANTPSRGKKRGNDGTILNTTNRDHNSFQPQSDASKVDHELESEEFRKVLKELGGTDEDLQLMADAASESDMEGFEDDRTSVLDSSNKKSLKQGMSNILKEIALAMGSEQNDSASLDNEVVNGSSSKKEESEDELRTENTIRKADSTSTKTDNEQPVKKKRDLGRLKCEPRPDWYAITSEIDAAKDSQHKPSTQLINQFLSLAKSLLDAENEAYKMTQRSASQAFYNTVIASGTLTDRISALTLAIQESPLHNTKALDTLVGLAGKRSRAQAVDVLRALKDLFAQGAVLPPDRRLYSFPTQPGVLFALSHVRGWRPGDKLPAGITEADLIRWAFEDELKAKYFDIIKILEVWCNDEIEFSKSRAVSYVYELLKERPEQESNLLRLLINKLGDPVRKIASQTSYLLMQLLVSHPAMKMVVISAIESDFLFRPGQSMHSKYYAVTTLNQTALSAREENVANKLLDIYFAMFAGLLKALKDETADEGKEVVATSRAQRQRQTTSKNAGSMNQQEAELRDKLVSAILTGVNRAYPYVGADQKGFDQHLDTLFRITHSANFNTGVQAMMLIQQLTSTHGAAADRFYRTLYESLLDPRLVMASKQQLYLNLLHRSLKADLNVKRVKAFVKRLLQILSMHDPSFVCGTFFLLKDLHVTFPSLSALLNQIEQIEDEEESFHDVDQDPVDNTNHEQYAGGAKLTNRYDGHKRAPEHANADNSCAWEVLPFLAHFHPSISVTADHYLRQEKLPGKADLSLHTLIHFLDRFVYRNPKLVSNRMRGASIMQPMAATDAHAVLINSTSGQGALSVNTDEFRAKKDVDVLAEEVFFHKYFKTLGKDTKANRKRESKDDDSLGGDDEDEVWKAMVDSARDLEGASSDEDLDMSSLDDAMSDGDDSDIDVDMDDAEVDVEAGIFDDDSDTDLAAQGLEGVDDTASDDISNFAESDSEPDANSKDDSNDVRNKSNKESRERRKKLKSLPTFASVADYAKLLDDDEDEDLG